MGHWFHMVIHFAAFSEQTHVPAVDPSQGSDIHLGDEIVTLSTTDEYPEVYVRTPTLFAAYLRAAL